MSDRSTSRVSLTLLTVMALCLGGCQGAFWGNIVVLGVTVGIFFGTLSLGRSAPTTSSAEASTSSGGQS